MMLKMRCTGGRYPHGLYTCLKPHTVSACLTVSGGHVTLQINDARYDDRWEHFEVTVDDLMEFLEACKNEDRQRSCEGTECIPLDDLRTGTSRKAGPLSDRQCHSD